MAPACSACGLSFERAQGYFVGAIYVNYAVTTVIVIGGYFLLWAFTELSTAAQLALSSSSRCSRSPRRAPARRTRS